MQERDIEAYLVKRVKELGGLTRKVQWIGMRGAPDRLVIMRGRGVLWIEIKAPDRAFKFPANSHERAQEREHERLRGMGQPVYVVDSKVMIDMLLA